MHIQHIQIHTDRFPTRERYPFSLATLQQTRELTLDSPITLSCPDAVIFSFDRSPISPIVYQETDHYRVYRDFMADPRGYGGDGGQGPGKLG